MGTPLLPCLQAISAVESKVIRRKKPPVYRHRTVDTRVPYTQVKWPEQTPTTQKNPQNYTPSSLFQVTLSECESQQNRQHQNQVQSGRKLEIAVQF